MKRIHPLIKTYIGRGAETTNEVFINDSNHLNKIYFIMDLLGLDTSVVNVSNQCINNIYV